MKKIDVAAIKEMKKIENFKMNYWTKDDLERIYFSHGIGNGKINFFWDIKNEKFNKTFPNNHMIQIQKIIKDTIQNELTI